MYHKIGLLGVLIITANTLPCIYSAFNGGMVPPFLSVLLMTLGLVFCLINTVKTKNHLYTFANGSGLVLNLILLIAIFERGLK